MPIFNAEDSTRSSLDRVRSSTASHANEEIKTWDYVKKRLAFGENAGLTMAFN